MKTSEQVHEIFTALSKAQGEMKNPEKNKTATIPTKAGTKYSYNYADLPSTLDIAREALAKNGLAHFSVTTCVDGRLSLQMRLTHSSGQWIESEVFLPNSEDPKALAANLTYFRRYLFTAIVGLAADDDLDSEPENENAKYDDRRAAELPTTSKGPASPVAPQRTAPAVQPKTVTRVVVGGGGRS